MLRIFQAILLFPSVTKRKIAYLLGITLTAAFFEGFGVAMLFPVMDFIEKGRDFKTLAGSSRMWAYIGKAFDILNLPMNLIVLMIIIFALLMVRQGFNYLKSIYGAWISESIFADIRGTGFKWFATADMPFFDTHGLGHLINVLTIDGVRAGAGVFVFFNLLGASVIFVLYFIFLLLLSSGMTLFALLIMGCVGMILRSSIRKSGDIGDEISKYNEKISFSIIERLNGIRLIKSFATEDQEANFIKALSEKIKRNTYNLAKIRARMEFVVDPMVILAGLTILYLSVEVFSMSLAKTGIFIFVLLRLMPYTKEIFNARQALSGLSGSLFRVRELLRKASHAEKIKGGDLKEIHLNRGIQFEDVSFSYNSGDGVVLEDINIFLPAGKMTALVGRSGAGKSTLLDLIPRLRVPFEGKISLDDVPIEEFDLPTLRRSIAFVSQEGFLFNDSIENNIKYCRPEAITKEIMHAAKMACADHFIKEFPKGYQAQVGERGVKLSGGQRQRIILARALLQKASIIILDEPTSSLDSESEKDIQKAMEKIRAEKRITMIIIAHRLSTIKRADQIIVLDKGKVIESGSHGDLMHEDSWYADMVRMQAAG